MRERAPAASDSFSSRAAARSQHASPLGSPRSAKAGPFQARLTERQQLALALEESLKAAQTPIAPDTDPHREACEGEHSSRSRAANSDDESSAEPSALRSIPAACSPRKRRRQCDDIDLSSTSQSFGQAVTIAAKEHSSMPVLIKQEVQGPKADKGNSCSESSRQSHSTALPAIRVSPARHVLSESSDSDSPCESPAGSRSAGAAAAQLDPHSILSFGQGSPPQMQFAAAAHGALSGGSHSQAGASDSPRPPDGNVGPPDAASPEVLMSEMSPVGKRGRELNAQEQRGSSKRLKPQGSLSPVHDAIPAIRGESEDNADDLAELCLDARHSASGGKHSSQAGKAGPSSVHLHVDAHQPRLSLSQAPACDAAPDIGVGNHGHASLPDARHISLSNGVRIALSMRPPATQATARQASVKQESEQEDSEQPPQQQRPKSKAKLSKAAPAGMQEQPAEQPTTSTSSQQQQQQPTRRITIRKPSGKAANPRRSGRVASADSPSEPSSPVGTATQPAAFLASPPASPTKRPQHAGGNSPFKSGKLGTKPAKALASVRPPLPRGASLDASYTPPGTSLSRGNSTAGVADGKGGQPARSSSRAQASLASLQRKLRSQEPLPEAVDPYAKPPAPKRSRAGGLAGGCARLRASDDGTPSCSCSLAGSAPSSPVQLSDSLSKSLLARAASVRTEGDQEEPSTPRGQQGISHPAEGFRVAPTSPFAGGCLPAFPESLPQLDDSARQLDDSARLSDDSCPLILASSIGHACKSLGDLHSRESIRWDSSVTAATSASRDTSPARQRSSPLAQKPAAASWGSSGRLGKALRSFAASQACHEEENPEEVCASGSGTFLKGCRLLCRTPSLDPCMRKVPPPLFRCTSNEQYLQGAYEDMLQRQALERETVDGLQGWLGPDTD